MNRSGNRRWNRAPWTLALLTTVCAELTFTAVAVPFTWLLVPLLMMMYGAGVLVLREATVRAGGTWPSLVLLGVAYQLAEDGLGLQALTSPRMYGAADWGFRALGVNWTYWESRSACTSCSASWFRSPSPTSSSRHNGTGPTSATGAWPAWAPSRSWACSGSAT
ncbi:hypothetical protein [Pseudonocardia alni]|uniref:hypothetical protein n=1 Tax=Pseudonocardia alni TaxID=33907 RepID=UPI001AD75BB5|nr:hypothetical protein [Pseudonocardia alni]